VSLAAAWQAAGVTPDAVAGHSQGEIAAATVAGILSLDDAARIVALRSKALIALAGRGGMVSVAEPAAAAADRIAAWGDRLSVAAVNGPAATVVSGDPAALAELIAACETAGVRARRLPVDYASHSAQVEAIREQILAALDGVIPGPARIPMISAMTGEFLDGLEAEAGYWYESLRAPVEFDRAVRALAGAGHRAFVEVSAHPVLTTAISHTVEDAGPPFPRRSVPVTSDGYPGPVPGRPGRGARAGRAGGLDGGADGRAADGAADIRVRAAAVLAAALAGPARGGGRAGCRRGLPAGGAIVGAVPSVAG